MYRIVIIVLIYHRYKPIDLKYAIVVSTDTFVVTKLFLNLKCKTFAEARHFTLHFVSAMKITIHPQTFWSSNSVFVTVVKESQTNLVVDCQLTMPGCDWLLAAIQPSTKFGCINFK
jgi:hypothetical protein